MSKKSIEGLCCCICGIQKEDVKKFYNSSIYSGGNPICGKHYSQIKLYGKTLDRTKFDKNMIFIRDDYAEIEITNKEHVVVAMAKIDLSDVDKVKDHKWHLDAHGYVCTKINRNRIKLHRFILDICNRNIHVDHVNHDKTDNRKSELRVCNNQENSRNKGYARSNTGFIGVSYSKRDKVYQAHIKHDYKKIFLGQSYNLSEALKLRLEAESKIFGDYAPQKHLFSEYGIRSDLVV